MTASEYRVIVCGSRTWTDRETIRAALEQLPENTIIIHGDNGYDADGHVLWGKPDHLAVRGADKLAGAIAESLGFTVRRYTPDFGRYGGKYAPRVRNERMLDEERPQLVLAFRMPGKSNGTDHMMMLARGRGVPVDECVKVELRV